MKTSTLPTLSYVPLKYGCEASCKNQPSLKFHLYWNKNCNISQYAGIILWCNVAQVKDSQYHIKLITLFLILRSAEKVLHLLYAATVCSDRERAQYNNNT